jgi:UDP-N-acetylglucosamine transferase subunit ALG13
VIFVMVSTGHFDPLIEMCNRLSSKYAFIGQVGSSTVVPVFPYFKTAVPPIIEKHISEAELVISHGGAGMTAMINRFEKRNIIIPKQRRYGEANDLQVELARKWADLGMTVLCMDVEDLDKAIQKCREFPFNFPRFPSLGSHLKSILELT